MENQFRKTIMQMSFDAALDLLMQELYKEGFELGGQADFQFTKTESRYSSKKHQVLSVYIPFLYSEMVKIAPFEGIILPCVVSMMEQHPGETTLVPYNATDSIVRGIQCPSLQNLATEVTRRLNLVVHALEKNRPALRDNFFQERDIRKY